MKQRAGQAAQPAPARGGIAEATRVAETIVDRVTETMRSRTVHTAHLLREACTAALAPWVLARVIVAVSLALAHYLVNHLHLLAAGSVAAGPAAAGTVFRVHQGLLGWDAGFYRAIADQGYGALGHEALRFFPLVPAVAHVVSDATRLSPGASLLVISNAAALTAGMLVYVLARRESQDNELARRASWLIALAPPAFVLVMGYSESVLAVFSMATLMALRARRWWWAVAAGMFAGLTRPVGVLLVLPALVESARGLAGASWKQRIARAAAVVSPVAGTAAYLAWVRWRFGDALLPLRIQTSGGHRQLGDPFYTMIHNASELFHGHHIGSAAHLPWVVLVVALTVICFYRWPASYGALAAGTLVAGVASTNLDSFERYALGAFPLVLAGAFLLRSRRIEATVYVLCGAGMLGYSLLAFLNFYVP